MDIVPVAAAELVLFREVAVEPAVPASVIDLGLRGTPNFEALKLARPDLIFNSAFYAWVEPRLAEIAPWRPSPSMKRAGAPSRARKSGAPAWRGARPRGRGGTAHRRHEGDLGE